MSDGLGPEVTPFDMMGGEAVARALAARFYDRMEATEPALAKLHRQGPDGRIDPEVRERFSLFLVGWLGGPDTYMQRHGHPRLRMRHAGVRVGTEMRDAWLACMLFALDQTPMPAPLRTYLAGRFGEVANFLRNVEGA
jgi:hemoglobin